ncbi:MAG: hypothetical protein AAB592_05970 [Patescibacteria group bacterium]
MAMVKLQSQFLFIGRGDDSFLENYSYELTGGDSDRGGKLFMSLEISNNQAEAEEIGEALFEIVKKVFFAELEKGAYVRFEEAVKAVNKTIDDFRAEKVSRFIGNLNVVIAAVHGSDLFVTQAGDGEAYLIRHRYVSVITEGLSDDAKHGDTFQNVASGSLEKSDVVVLSSSRLLRYVTKNEFGKIFSSRGDANILETSLAELQDMLTTEILGRVAVIGAFAEDKKGEEEESSGMLEGAATEGFSGVVGRFGRLGTMLFGGKGAVKGLQSLREVFKAARAPSFLRDRVTIALIFVIAVLLISIFWLRTRGNQEKLIAELDAKLAHVQEIVQDAATQGQFDKDRGAELLATAEQQALEVLNSRFLRAKASKMLDEIERQRALLDNVKYIEEPQVYADLGEKDPSFDARGMSFVKDRLIVFGGSSLHEVLLGKVQNAVTLNASEEIALGASSLEQNGMVFITKTGRVIEYADSLISFIDATDGTLKRGVDLDAYNDKLYVLDPAQNQIWRYKRRRTNYDPAEQYNTANIDLANAVSVAIDSSIYVLNSDGTIFVLYAGEKQEFSILKSPLQGITEATKIFTEPDQNYLFILEPRKDRILSFAKDFRQGGPSPKGAVYNTQYVFNNLDGDIVDFYVSRDEGKLYVLAGNKIYVTPLQ